MSAAIEACRDRDAIDIFILHPKGRTSEVQRRQMTTIDARNVHNIALEGTGLVFSALKPAQIGSPMVLRCFNATGRKVSGAWRFGRGVKTAHRVRADEREAVALVLEQRGNVVRFVAEPHEMVSILVT